VAAGTALILMMLVVLVDVVGRGIFNSPLAIGTDLTEVLMMVLVFLSFPLLTYRQRDITVDLFEVVHNPHFKKLQIALAGLCGALVFGLASWQFFIFGERAARSGEMMAEIKLPLSYVWYFMGAFGWITTLAALLVTLSAFTSHPVEPEIISEVD
jgi:TRAP-type C4-dicarboxylate transport system permease small subunit